MTPDRQREIYERVAEGRARAAFDALPIPAHVDLATLSDHQLADVARAREVAYQDALGEVERRRIEKGSTWDEATVAAALAQKRNGGEDFSPRTRISELPPALFRMGYEWCAITMLDVLSGVIGRPSPDIVMIHESEPAGRGLYRLKGEPKVFDPRRRAALDLINTLQNYTSNQQQGMFTTYRLRVTYDPADDQKLAGDGQG